MRPADPAPENPIERWTGGIRNAFREAGCRPRPGLHVGDARVIRRPAVILLLATALLTALAPVPVAAGVRYGDAVPGVIRPSDLERIKRVLRLDRFSVIAAVRLGAEDGREAIITEPLSDETLTKVKDACEGGGFCPDPVGFVASRVLIVLLRDEDVETVVMVQSEARGPRGRLIDLRDLGVEGEILGWNGRADAADGHVALSLTPITTTPTGKLGAGLDPPLLIRFNSKRDRFQVYDCVVGDGGVAICEFEDEAGD